MIDATRYRMRQQYRMRPAVTTAPIIYVSDDGKLHVLPAGTELPVTVETVTTIKLEK